MIRCFGQMKYEEAVRSVNVCSTMHSEPCPAAMPHLPRRLEINNHLGVCIIVEIALPIDGDPSIVRT